MAKARSRVQSAKLEYVGAEVKEEEVRKKIVSKSVLEGVEIDSHGIYDEDGNLNPGYEEFVRDFGTFESISDTLLAGGIAEALGLKKAEFSVDRYSRNQIIATLKFTGDDGGAMVREFTFNPNTGEWAVKHTLFEIAVEKRSSGVAAQMMKNATEFYIERGIKEIEIFASLNNGGYTWTRFGAKFEDVSEVRDDLKRVLQYIPMPSEQRTMVTELLNGAKTDEDLWKIADLKHETNIPLTHGSDKMKTIGQALFSRIDWFGSISLEKGSVERERTMKYIYDSYLKRGKTLPDNYVEMWMDR